MKQTEFNLGDKRKIEDAPIRPDAEQITQDDLPEGDLFHKPDKLKQDSFNFNEGK